MLNIYLVYEINLLPWKYISDPDKYKYSGCGIGFIVTGAFPLSHGSGFDKNVIMFGADMSSSVPIDNWKKYILIFRKGPMQWLDNTALIAEKSYATNFSEQLKKFSIIMGQIVIYLLIVLLKSINWKQKILQ